MVRGGGGSDRWDSEASPGAEGSADRGRVPAPGEGVLQRGVAQSKRGLCDAGSAGRRRRTGPRCLEKLRGSREGRGDARCPATFLLECISQCDL